MPNDRRKLNLKRAIQIASLALAVATMMALAAAGLARGVVAATDPVGGTSPRVMSQSACTIEVDSTCNVEIRVQAGQQSVSGVEVFLDFDPQSLQVEDADTDKPDTQIQPGPQFPTPLYNFADNTSGEIHFATGQLGNPPFPTGDILVATVTFRVQSADPFDGRVAFSLEAPRMTGVDSGGDPLSVELMDVNLPDETTLTMRVDEVALRFAPAPLEGEAGTEVTASVVVESEDVAKVANIELKVHFDSNVVQVVDDPATEGNVEGIVQGGDLPEGFQFTSGVDNAAGVVSVVAGGTTAIGGSTASVTVAEITFELVGSSGESTPLEFNEIRVSDEQVRFLGFQAGSGSITVTAADNTPPVATDDAYSTDEDTTLTVDAASGVLANDTDVDEDSLTAGLVSEASNGTLTLNEDGSFTYTPAAEFTGSDSFTYTANDGQADSNTATVTITVNEVVVNTPPVATDDAYDVDEDGTLEVPALGVLANDTDGEGDALTAVLASDVSNGTLTLNQDGSFTYTPNAGFIGADSFTYKANDGQADSNTATVTITVNEVVVNTPPVATDDAYDVDEDGTLEVPALGVLANDTDAEGDALTAALVEDVSNGTLTLNPDGSFDYTPDADFNGEDSFTYIANDGQDDSNTATVTITVNAVNDPPVAEDDIYNVGEGETLEIPAPGLLANDSDADGDTLTVSLAEGGDVSNGTLTLNSDGSFSYTPDAGFTGADSFTYIANDGQADSDVATVTITALPPITLMVGDAAGRRGESVTVSVTASGVQPLGLLRFDVRFDTDVVAATSATTGSLPDGWTFNRTLDNVQGIVSIEVKGDVAAGVESFKVADLTFELVGNAGESTALSFENVAAFDPSDPPVPIGYEADEGNISILPVALRLAPEATTVGLLDTFEVEIVAELGQQPVSGVQVFLDFDPAALEVVDADPDTPGVQIRPGPDLDDHLPTGLENEANNELGYVGFATGKLDVAAPVGDFVLAVVEFKARPGAATSDTEITFSVDPQERETIVDSGGTPVPANLFDATLGLTVPVRVVFRFQGGARPEPEGWQQPVTVKLVPAGEEGEALTLEAEPSQFSKDNPLDKHAFVDIPAVAVGVYDISITGPSTLTNQRSGVPARADLEDFDLDLGILKVDLGTLLSGNAINQQGEPQQIINNADFGVLAGAFGTVPGSEDFKVEADFDANGVINISDFGLLASNINKTSPVPVP